MTQEFTCRVCRVDFLVEVETITAVIMEGRRIRCPHCGGPAEVNRREEGCHAKVQVWS